LWFYRLNRDLAGECGILWRYYFDKTDAIIFVIDSADKNRRDEITCEFETILNAPELKEAALLVFANKQDLPQAMSMGEITEWLVPKFSQDRLWHIQPACATSGDGLYEGMQWLTNILKKR